MNSWKVGFWDFVSMGRVQRHGNTGYKKLYFTLFGTPDIHTRIRNTFVLNTIAGLDLPTETAVLDIGCGRAVPTFFLAEKNPRWQFTGIELDPVLAHPAQQTVQNGRWPNIQIIEGDVMELADKEKYGLAYCIDVMEHIPQDVQLMRQVWQALKPGGYFVVHVPRRRQEQWRLFTSFEDHEVDGHVRNEYSAEELQERFTEAGFQVKAIHQTIGKPGEAAFEINMLFWRWSFVRFLFTVPTFPITLPLAWLDTKAYKSYGNAYLVVAQKQG